MVRRHTQEFCSSHQTLSSGGYPAGQSQSTPHVVSSGGYPAGHREKCIPLNPSTMVCRPYTRKEMLGGQAATTAIHQEWVRLRARRSWGEDHPREWSDVAREARESGQEIHVGMISGFLAAKNTDMPHGGPQRNYKGRVVFPGTTSRSRIGRTPSSPTWAAHHRRWTQDAS